MTHLDEGVDFNCVSTQEKHLCPNVPCETNLATYQAKLDSELP
jgi:hypothetical protein